MEVVYLKHACMHARTHMCTHAHAHTQLNKNIQRQPIKTKINQKQTNQKRHHINGT